MEGLGELWRGLYCDRGRRDERMEDRLEEAG